MGLIRRAIILSIWAFFNGINTQSNHSLNLGLLQLIVGDGLRKFLVDKRVHPQVSQQADGNTGQRNTNNGFPFTGGCLTLSEGLTEAGSVQNLLLLPGHLLPVSLLLLAQGNDLSNVLLEPNSGERSHNVVHVVGLTVDTIAYDLALADQQLGHGWWGSVAAISGGTELNPGNFPQQPTSRQRRHFDSCRSESSNISLPINSLVM